MKLYSILALLSITGLYVSTYSLKPGPSITKDEKGPAVYCSPSFDPKNINSPAPLLKGLGNINYPVTTSSPQARQYFNQGLALTYGFNHGEAARSFNTAIKLDP